MAERSDDIHHNVDALRHNIDETRASLDSKLNQLEQQARQNLDVKHQVEQHPFAMFGLAVAAGYALGSMGQHRETHDHNASHSSPRSEGYPRIYEGAQRSDQGQGSDDRYSPQGSPHQGSPHQGSPHQGSPHQGSPHQGSPHQGSPHQGSPHQGRREGVFGQFDQEIELLKNAAVATLGGLLRDVVHQVAPTLGENMERIRSDRKIGGLQQLGNGQQGREPSSGDSDLDEGLGPRPNAGLGSQERYTQGIGGDDMARH